MLISPREYCLEGCDHRRVELALHSLGKPQSSHTAWHRISVRTIRCHRVVCVRYSNDPRQERDVLLDHLVRIPEPIDPLVMMPDNSSDLSVVIDFRQDALPNRRVLLHLSAFVKGQGSSLLKKTCGETDLSDVVDEAAEVRQPLLAIAQSKS
jgi:hypothetical protein